MKSVAIVGSAPSSQNLAPFNSGEGEVWVLGPQARYHKERGQAFTRIFEVHSNFEWSGDSDYAQSLIKFDVPLIVNEGFPVIDENVKIFPLEMAAAILDTNGKPYLTSTIAYMIALAIIEGFDKISVYGVDLSVHDREYFHQRACTEAWLGLARGRGIEIFIPEQSSVMKSTFVYGVDDRDAVKGGPFSEDAFVMMAGKHQAVMAEIEQKMQELETKRIAHEVSYNMCMKLSEVARGVEGGAQIKDINDVLLVKS